MYRSPSYSSSNIPRSLKEIENLDVDDDDDDNTSVYSQRSNYSTRSSRSTISDISQSTMRSSSFNPTSSIYQPKIQQNIIYEEDINQYQEEEELDEEEYEELTDDNPDFVLFKEEVRKWLTLDDDIRTLQKAMNERKKVKNELTPRVLEFMGKYDIQNLNTQEGKIQYAKSIITKPMNKDYLKTRLSEFLKNMDKAERCTDFLLKNRIKEEKVRIKRVIEKNQNKL